MVLIHLPLCHSNISLLFQYEFVSELTLVYTISKHTGYETGTEPRVQESHTFCFPFMKLIWLPMQILLGPKRDISV